MTQHEPTFQPPRYQKPTPPPPPPLQTRQPTGLPTWPLGLLAGIEGSGKSIKLAEASTSDMVNRTFWIGCGEDDPDEYGAFVTADGRKARFEIVLHDGTYRGILNAIESAVAQPPAEDGTPNLVVFDSGSRFWHQLAGDMQQNANERQAKREAKFGNKEYALPEDGVSITMDLWNTAKDRWGHVLDALRAHQGPVLITSRLDLVTVMDDKGNPTKEKQWKIQAEKNLPYEVGFVVQMRASYPERDDYLTKVKSLRYKHKVSRGKVVAAALGDDWTIESLWKQLGLDEVVGERVHANVVQRGDESEAATRAALLEDVAGAAGALGIDPAAINAHWMETHNGQSIRDASDFEALRAIRDDLVAQVGARVLAPAQDAPADAPQGAPAQQEERAPEPQEAAPQEQRTDARPPAEAPPQTSQQKAFEAQFKMVTDELRFQAETLGQSYDAYVAPTEGVPVKMQKQAVAQRAGVIEVLRMAARSTEADAYARMGDAPFLNIGQVINAEPFTREQADQPAH